jgi:hypothetical protein
VGTFAQIVTGSTRLRRACAGALAGLAAFALAGCSDDGDDTPTTEVPVLDADAGLVGTCLAFPADVGAEISSFPAVDCAASHTHEVFAVVTSAESNYPGFEALEAEAQVACLAEFEPYVGVNPFDSELFYEWIVPTLDSWDRADDREIVCVAGNHDGAPLVGSIQNARR